MKRKNHLPEDEIETREPLTMSAADDSVELSAEELKNTWLDLNEVYVFF